MRLRVDFSVETLERRSLMEAETDGGDGVDWTDAPGS